MLVFNDSELFLSVKLSFGFSGRVVVNFGALNIPPRGEVPKVGPEVPNVEPNIVDPVAFGVPNISPLEFEAPNIVPNVEPFVFEDPNVFEPIGEVTFVVFREFVLLKMVFPEKLVFPKREGLFCGT